MSRRQGSPLPLLAAVAVVGYIATQGGLPTPAHDISGPYATVFEAAGRRHGVDPALLSAIAKAESGYNPHAGSSAGAGGLMQLMPGTARELGVDRFSVTSSVDGAARLVAAHQRSFGGVDEVLAAYNAGPGAVRKYGGVPPFVETRAYVVRVKQFRKEIAGV